MWSDSALDEFEHRTKTFAIEVIRLCLVLSEVRGLRFLTDQLASAASSTAANHRAMRRARSRREFGAKLQIVSEEIDETVLWLEMLDAVHPDSSVTSAPILREALQLRAMFARSRRTLRERAGPRNE